MNRIITKILNIYNMAISKDLLDRIVANSPRQRIKLASKKERDLLKKLTKMNPNVSIIYETEEDGNDRFEAFLKWKNKTFITEVKCRNIKSTDFDYSFIEVDKVDNLFNLAKILNTLGWKVEPLLVISFIDNVTIIYRPTQEEKITEVYANKETCDPSKGKKLKKMYNIPIKQTKKITMN